VLSPCSSFNSLSRDHLRRRRRCAPVRTRNLSTPSLGITDLVDAVAYAVKELYAFNSLSRDHAHREARLPSCDSLRGTFNSLSRDHDDIIGDVAVYRKDFQLPLSGSLSGWPPPSPSRPMRLSTPSLGITFYLCGNCGGYHVPFQLPLSGSPKIWGNICPICNWWLSTPSLGITEFLKRKPLPWYKILLSTPSLGITRVNIEEAVERIIKAFNSLSRDHGLGYGIRGRPNN